MKITFLSFCILTSLLSFAQKGETQNVHYRFTADIIEELQLNDEQMEEYQSIKEETKSKMKEVRMSDNENKRNTIQSLRKESYAKTEAILNAEQLAKWEVLKKEKLAKSIAHQERKKAAKAELKAYEKENIKPFISGKRAILDTKFSIADRQSVDELRKVYLAVKKEIKAESKLNKEDKNQGSKKFKGHYKKKKKREVIIMERFKEKETVAYNQAEQLVKKYAKDIFTLQEEIQKQRPVWKEDLKAIKDKYREENPNQEKNKTKHKMKSENPNDELERISDIRFLLLNSK